MGSRFVLPVLAVVLLLAGVATWLFSSGEPGEAASPIADSPVAAETETPAASVEKPMSETAEEKTSARKAEPVMRTPQVAAEKQDDAKQGQRVVGRLVDKLGTPILCGTASLARPLSFGLGQVANVNEPDVAVSSEVEGRFSLEVDGVSTKIFLAQATGYAPIKPREIHVPASGDLDLGDVVLSEGAILSGHVYDANGSPVEGARLMNSHSDESGFMASVPLFARMRKPLAVTNRDGAFRVESLACGAWEIVIRSEDHPSLTVSGVADIPGAEVSGLSFQLAESGTISGAVVGVPDDGGGGLVVRARPVAENGGFSFGLGVGGMREAQCSADGAFTLKGLEAGKSYELQARERRTTRFDSIFTGSDIRSDSVRARAGSTGLELLYSRGATLTFEVIDDSNGEPVTAMTISVGARFLTPVLDDDDRIRREYPDGLVEISGLYPRGLKKTVSIKVKAIGFQEHMVKDVEYLPGDDMQLGTIRLTPTPVLVVNVTDAKSGAPVTGARVGLSPAPEPVAAGERRMDMNFRFGGEDDEPINVMGGGNSAVTDEFGVATLNSLEDTDCILRVESDGHAPFEDPRLFLPSGKRVERDVALREGGSVWVTVLDPDGRPMQAVEVDHRDASSGPERMMFGGRHRAKKRTDSSGRVLFAHLEPGLHSFRISDSKGPDAGFMGEGEAVVMLAGMGGGNNVEPWTEVQVAEGSEEAIQLSASPRGRLEGRVREAGVVLAGATLSLSPRKEESAELGGFDPSHIFGGAEKARTDGDGYYSFDGVKPGEYTLEVSHPSRVLSTELDLEIRERGGKVELRLDVELTVAVIEGHIEDEDGKPLANVEVWAERFAPNQPQMMRFMVIDDSDTGGSMSFGDEASDGRVRTDGDGFYSLRGVSADVPITIHADGSAFQEAESEQIVVGEDEVLSGVDLVMRAAGEVEVTVVGADGAAPGMCMIVATYLGSEPVDTVREMGSPSGTTRLRGLRPGQWELTAQVFGGGGMGQSGDEQIVTVVAGETGVVTITTP